ncbi:undecaprenyldiphospho-muramoylpentapeptide beta-N-acetylglucosaminyltransferase [Eubacterium ruminantium]|uniref:undecaprenyldiphospho-muramoylpentapeptide beta-N-acetylglucosaminyltransferase n=1 Tax=Eubacterium ruminantium TaxID=42322 RepID=UPI001567D39C|nr:undecaprenyldiphospho-muramoylpentapeptide beta-N-acetylglucosaminyltransferase [Eubacterium ruminantium]
MKKIILTGGGTAGHVTPNIALMPRLKELGYEIHYVGSYEGIEKKLIEELGIPYHGVSSGKLRRYFDFRNFIDPFKVVIGYLQSKKLMRKIKPDIVFSKGGFVSMPVTRAAAKKHIPVILHESDMTPGLANRLALKKADKICCNFPETSKSLPDGKAVVTGTPIREELFKGDKEAAKKFCGFTDDKPVILFIGGSSGSQIINDNLAKCIDTLLKDFNIIHLTGKGKANKENANKTGYVQFEYIKKELADLFALADIAVSRAGANAICELLALRKPNVLIPLSLGASRGDQILNAASFEKSGYSKLLKEEDMTPDTLVSAIKEAYNNREKYIESMSKSQQSDAITKITELIETLVNKNSVK